MFFWTAMWYNLPELKVIAAFIYMLRGSNDMEKKIVLSITPTYMITILLNMKTVSVSVVEKK